MKTKITILLCLLVLGVTTACDHTPDCKPCGFRAGAQAVISFPQNSGRQQITRVVDPGGCVTYSPSTNGGCNGTVTVIGGNFTFFASPESVDLQAPPASFGISGSGISTTYGMPKIQYWDDFGQLLGETTASSVSGDGTWLEAPTPSNTWQAYSGRWTVYVMNRTWDGSIEHAGSALVYAYGRDYEPPPPPPDEDPCYNQNPDRPQMECYLTY